MLTRSYAQGGYKIQIITDQGNDRVSVGVRPAIDPAYESDGTDEVRYTWAHFNIKETHDKR